MAKFIRRSLIFCTFFVASAALALLLTALGTKHWAEAGAKRLKNPVESDGKIHFGLFEGKKELNVAYGWRTYEINVINMLKYEPQFLNYWLWLGTVSTLCASLLFATFSVVFAVVNTTTTTQRWMTKVSGLMLWNFLTLLGALCGIGFWLVQHYTKVQYNVLSREDMSNEWTSDGMADLGYSFWFVVGAASASFVNIVLLIISTTEKDIETVIPVLEEKTNGAIMLY
ncbi:clarin-2 [Cylas formicarius]|uniref:clarin-2 n=1 Tax=Cylas formicarius TaxID=197179 RepID=UPI0029586FE4|nr:clarin-2 [Cylas formicarius]XP_060527503.1 clarin-2 [Cylas formicarius]XP_060527504.1 clarin-2 [Cylas formicarius]